MTRWRPGPMAAAAGLWTVFVLVVTWWATGWVTRRDRVVFDLFASMTGPGQATGQVVIATIDDASLAAIGRWPWPRNILAQLVESIRARGAAAIVLDMVFPEPDNNRTNTPGEPITNDQRLAQAMQGNVIIGRYLYFGEWRGALEGCQSTKLQFARAERERAATFVPYRAEAGLCSVRGVAQAAAASGFLNGIADGDGRLRRAPLVAEFRGEPVPSLAIAALGLHEGKGKALLLSSAFAHEIHIGARRIPVEGDGSIRLRFRDIEKGIARIPVAELLSGFCDAKLEGKIVVVGGSAVGLQDSSATRVDPSMPGVQLQANIIDNLLAGDFFHRPIYAPFIEALACLAIGAVTVAFAHQRVAVLLAIVVSGMALAAFGAISLLHWTRLHFSLIPAALCAAGLILLTPVCHLYIQRRRTEATELELAAVRRFAFHSMTMLSKLRDPEMGNHLIRVQRYLRPLCAELTSHPRFRSFLTPETIEALIELAPIHDIGKTGVPDAILQKPGSLTVLEYERIKQHVRHGTEIIESAAAMAGVHDSRWIALARDIVNAHHEQWDGRGYPAGLRGDQIPAAGRLVAIADVYDALISRRVYKAGKPHNEAVQTISALSGRQFDPEIVAAFLRVQGQWQSIAIELGDTNEEPERSTGATAG